MGQCPFRKGWLYPLLLFGGKPDHGLPAGEINLTNFHVDWTASGYRLPTEAEWEVAARGGLVSNKYSWGNSPFPSKANYVDTRVGKTTAVGTFDPNGYGIHDIGGNLREWTWDWYDSRTYEYEWKEEFPNFSGFYNLVDEGNSSAKLMYDDTVIIPSTESNRSIYTTSTAAVWEVAKSFVLSYDKNVSYVSNQLRTSRFQTTTCKVKFIYDDNSSMESSQQSHYSSHSSGHLSYSNYKSYNNPNTGKLVRKIEILLHVNGSTGYERNTFIRSSFQNENISFFALNIPQYSEQNPSHFRVKVDATRQWVMIFGLNWSTRTTRQRLTRMQILINYFQFSLPSSNPLV